MNVDLLGVYWNKIMIRKTKEMKNIDKKESLLRKKKLPNRSNQWSKDIYESGARSFWITSSALHLNKSKLLFLFLVQKKILFFRYPLINSSRFNFLSPLASNLLMIALARLWGFLSPWRSVTRARSYWNQTIIDQLRNTNWRKQWFYHSWNEMS